MSELTEQLDKIIQQAALDGALTQKAVDQFHSVLTQNTALETKVASLEIVVEERAKRISGLEIDIGLAKTLVEVAGKAEIEMMEREKKMTELELRAEYQLVRVNDHKEMFTTVFRNSVLRKEVMTPVTPAPMDQGMRGTDGYPQRDTVEEEEK
jgi:hypothetical protein